MNYIISFTDILGLRNYIREYESGKKPELLDIIKDSMGRSVNLLKMNISATMDS